MGHTAMIEHFRYSSDGVTITSSHNHHFLGDINRWFTYSIAGLRPISADTVEICPEFISAIDSAEASYKLPAGEIEVKWARDGKNITVDIFCDAGVKTLLSPRLAKANVNIRYR